jgi:hypothetical protein
MILSSLDIYNSLASDPIINGLAKIFIIEGNPPLGVDLSTVIYISKYPKESDFEVQWKIWVVDIEDVTDIIVAQIQWMYPRFEWNHPGSEYNKDTVIPYGTLSDIRTGSTLIEPPKVRPSDFNPFVQQFEQRFQDFTDQIEDRMLLFNSGRDGKDGAVGPMGPAGPEGAPGADLVATEVSLGDLKDVFVPDPKQGQFLMWDGSDWISRYVPQVISSRGAGVQLPEGGLQNQVLVKSSNTSWDTEWTSDLSINSVNFDLQNEDVPVLGQINWNIDEETLALGLSDTVQLHLGRDILNICRNGTNQTIQKGTAVMFAGTLGASGRIVVAPMIANGSYPGYVFLGIAAENIPPNEDGNVSSYGEVKGVNTSSYPEGSILWCNPAVPGGLTSVEPSAPNLKLPVAAAVSQKNNGTLMVRWDTGRRLKDLHDVEVQATPQDGDVLTYNGTTNRWENISTNWTEEAPQDGNYYVRQNGQWVELSVAIAGL